MKNLLAFGCSCTAGEGLPARELAWPELLATLLKYQCINKGKQGASNKHIRYLIQNYSFSKNDIVIIQWTNADRTSVISQNTVKDILPKDADKSKWIKSYFQNLNTKIDSLYDLYTNANYIKYYLDDLGIPNYHCILHKSYKTNFKWSKVQFYKGIHDEFCIDSCDDKLHPGIKSHKKFAKYLYKQIGDPIEN